MHKQVSIPLARAHELGHAKGWIRELFENKFGEKLAAALPWSEVYNMLSSANKDAVTKIVNDGITNLTWNDSKISMEEADKASQAFFSADSGRKKQPTSHEGWVEMGEIVTMVKCSLLLSLVFTFTGCMTTQFGKSQSESDEAYVHEQALQKSGWYTNITILGTEAVVVGKVRNTRLMPSRRSYSVSYANPSVRRDGMATSPRRFDVVCVLAESGVIWIEDDLTLSLYISGLGLQVRTLVDAVEIADLCAAMRLSSIQVGVPSNYGLFFKTRPSDEWTFKVDRTPDGCSTVECSTIEESTAGSVRLGARRIRISIHPGGEVDVKEIRRLGPSLSEI